MKSLLDFPHSSLIHFARSVIIMKYYIKTLPTRRFVARVYASFILGATVFEVMYSDLFYKVYILIC